jgi:phage gp29-like protein
VAGRTGEAAARRVPIRSIGPAIAAGAAALWLAVSAPVRRVIAPARGSATPTPWHRRAWALMSMQRARALGETAPTGQQARELPYDNVQNHPGYGYTVERVIALYGLAEAGYPREQCDLFDDLIEGNCHARSIFEQRDQAVAGKPFVVQAGDDSDEGRAAAEALKTALSRLQMIPFFTHQLGGANRYGWGATEIDWGIFEHGGRTWVVPVWLANVPARRFVVDVTTNSLRLITKDLPSKGEELIPGKWVVTRRPGPLARAGLMRTATFALGYIRFGTRDWVIFSHKFGLPLVVAQYDDQGDDNGTTDDGTRQVLQDVVKNVGQDGGAVLPKSASVTLHAAGAGDASKTQGSLIAYCNAELSKLVLGATLTADNAGSGGASYALGEVHASVRWDNITFDAALVEESFRTQLGAAFVRFNGLACAAPLLRIQVVRDLTPKVRAEVTKVFVNDLGGKASHTQLAEELGYRAPIDDEDQLPGAKTPAAAPVKEEA